MTPDLDSLRIDRDAEPRVSSGSARPWMLVSLLLLVLLVLSVVFPPHCPGETAEFEPEPSALTEPDAEPDSGDSAFSASGWVKLPLRYPVLVTPLVEGRIEELLVVEGDAVAAGQIVARLYDGDLRAELDAAEARGREAAAALEKHETGSRPQKIAEARAEVVRIEAELAVAREVLAHSLELQPQGAISLEELQRDEAAVEMLEAELVQAGERAALQEEGFRAEDVALARATLERARAEEEIAKLRLGYVEIASPIDGIVIERRADVGQWIRPADGFLLSLYDPSDLEVRVDVNQADLARVFPGQAVEISSKAEEGKVLIGEVLLVEPRADVVKNTVAVRVRLEPIDGAMLHPDMVVRARFLPAPESE